MPFGHPRANSYQQPTLDNGLRAPRKGTRRAVKSIRVR